MNRMSKALVIFCALVLLPIVARAEELTILYTGETHAMLYPCSCPIQPDGGIARRATLVKELRKSDPNLLLLDSGAVFAGGLLDEYTQNTELDKQRTSVALKAIDMMRYDAVTVGDEEFDFGKEFFDQYASKAKFKFISANITSPNIYPYIIKEVKGVKVGVIGVSPMGAAVKAGGIQFDDPVASVKKAVDKLKADGVNVIVLLSHQGEKDDIKLLTEVKGIDVLIVGNSRSDNKGPSEKFGPTIILRPSWQGRRMGKLVITLKDKKVVNYKAEELRLSSALKDDPDILKILPKCFSDINCKKEGFNGSCQNPGNMKSACIFNAANKVNLTVIKPKDCAVCNTDNGVQFLKRIFPGLNVTYLDYPQSKASKLVKDLGITGLPAYLLGKEVNKEKMFDNLKLSMQEKGGYYVLKPEFAGVAYFTNRKYIKNKLDLFISLFDKNAFATLNAVRDFKPDVHFLVAERNGGLSASRGIGEVEEDLRALCVQKLYPDMFWGYITCRAKNIESSWWEDCLGDYDAGKVKACARSNESYKLLKDNIAINKEIQAMVGPAYLMNNQEIFATQGVPSKEELAKTIKKR